jgi:hypothetical protein
VSAIEGASQLDKLLFAKLEMPSQFVLDNIENYNAAIQRVVCRCYKVAVDIIREILSSFALATVDRVDECRLISRINFLVEAESMLLTLLQRCPTAVDAMLPNHSIGSNDSKSVVKSKIKVSTKKPKQSAKTMTRKKNRNEKGPALSDADDDDGKGDKGGEMNSQKPKESHILEVDKDKRLLMQEGLAKAVEAILRPLHAHVGCALGIGLVNFASVSDGEEMGGAIMAELNEKSVMRLLQHILACIKAFDKNTSMYSTSSGIILTATDLLSSSMTSAVALLSKLSYTNNVSICSIDEIHLYTTWQASKVFDGLLVIMSEFGETLAALPQYEQDSVDSSILRRGSSSTVNVSGISTSFDSRIVEPEEFSAKMTLVLTIIHRCLLSKVKICHYNSELFTILYISGSTR